IDKRTYVDRFSLPELALDGRYSNAYTIERSSGHSGGSYYWLRLPEEDAMFPQYLEHAFSQFYGMGERSTLVLITLALGTWTSGEKMAQALRQVAAKGRYELTVMAPGTDIDEILQIVGDLGPHYDQVVIVGYPPFLKTVIDEGFRRGIDWKSINVKLGLGGEGYSEQWRAHVGAQLGIDASKDLLAISGGYGAADIGMSIGREYPLTVLMRQLCVQDPALAQALFDDRAVRSGTLPGLMQYNPVTSYIEEVGGELVFTVLSGIPLVRYNIHDSGGVLPFEQTLEMLKDHGYDIGARLAALGYGGEQLWRLPFFYVFGRSDGTVSIVGANIFPENIQAILSESSDDAIVTFRLSVSTSDDFSQRLVVDMEHHSEDLLESEAALLSERYRVLLLNGLRRINQDFRDAHDDNPQCADPIVTIHCRRTGPFTTSSGIKNLYIAKT
ncbi:MAG: hypothetical protein Q7V14_05175, partial [Coriobacteriia bacterium]|nr:hypothetical protein [Coriobacteriia bacterium]